jgi:hypothetical protein
MLEVKIGAVSSDGPFARDRANEWRPRAIEGVTDGAQSKVASVDRTGNWKLETLLTADVGAMTVIEYCGTPNGDLPRG